jgi:UDP-4-amino-4,6-dideoxy-N-acetyl-beta-L-altrosamine N-acetyltransferase
MFRFVKLNHDYLEIIYLWRKSEAVSRFMLTEISSDINDHYKWFENIRNNSSYQYWVIHFNNVPIGLINLAKIDRVHRHLSIGYYIGEKKFRSLGALIPPYVYNYVFREMNFHKIYGEVIGGNDKVLKMHAIHGYREVGVFKDHHYRDEKFYDVFLIELLSRDWCQLKKYEKYIEKFN